MSLETSTSDLDGYLDTEEREHEDSAKRKIGLGNLRRLTMMILREQGPLWSGLLAVVFGTFCTLLEPRLFGYAIDLAIVPKRWDLLRWIVLIFLGVTVIRVFSVIAQGYLFEMLGQRVTQRLRIRLFSHLQRLPVTVYDKNPAGRLLTRASNDIESLNEMFSAGFVSMVGNILMVVGIFTWLMVLDLRLGLIAGAVFPPLAWASGYFSGRLRIAYRESRSKLSALNAFLAENLLGMKVIHLFNREKLHLDRFDRINQWYADSQIGTVQVFALFQPTITLSSGISMALVVWFGGVSTRSGSLKVGALVAFFSYVLSAFQPMREIADKWNIFLSGFASAERIFSILSWKTELRRDEVRATPAPLEEIRGHIVFENVWFAYDEERWILKDFNLEISPGSKVGIVGHTGSGKTTLISLLMRFYEPQRGRILLDGRDLRDYDRRALRAAIGIVQQDVFIFSGTYEENINFWGPKFELPTGLRDLTASAQGRELQERGSNVSVGQKQVLAFARTLASRPKVWILDEATANMDSDTESKLQAELDLASRGQTSLLIAHRLATVRTADQILVLHKGVLVEQGRHEELLRRGGLYARLYRFQMAQELAERARDSVSAELIT